MSLKHNILATYLNQFYVALVGILMVPIYIRYMGAEAYGLVSFYAMLQAWFQLLDLGLTPTMAREVARFQGGDANARQLRSLLRSLEGIFLAVAILGGGCILLGAENIARDWLRVQQLSLQEVRYALMLMGLIIVLRWIAGLYRAAINGFEHIVWLSGFNIAIATIRFLLVIPFLLFVSASVVDFFIYQLSVATAETIFLILKTYRLLPKAGGATWLPWKLDPLLSVLKFSASIAIANLLWIAATQIDKLVLSKLLPLSEYGYFSLVVSLAGGITLLAAPFSTALLPRLARISAQGEESVLIALYRESTQLVCIIVAPVSIALALFPEKILWVWTGSEEISGKMASVMVLYAIGNGIQALGAFPYYLQYAKGSLKLHLIGSALSALLLVPAVVWGVQRYGVVGAGYAWVGVNGLYFLFWVAKVHNRFAKGIHFPWMFQDVGVIVLLTSVLGLLVRQCMEWPKSREAVALILGGIFIVLFISAALSSSQMRGKIRNKIKTCFLSE